MPLKKGKGEPVFAGSVNVQNPFDMTVTALPNQSLLSNMVRLAQRAAADKPIVAQLADKVAGYFVLLVLAMALLAAVYWYFVEPTQVFAITLAVLVVSCPCALSLATPVALSVANKQLMHTGIMPTTGTLLPGLAEVDTVLFDKTGTLTDGKLKLQSVLTLGERDEGKLLQLAMTLEFGVSHPLAKALLAHGDALGLCGLAFMGYIPPWLAAPQ